MSWFKPKDECSPGLRSSSLSCHSKYTQHPLYQMGWTRRSPLTFSSSESSYRPNLSEQSNEVTVRRHKARLKTRGQGHDRAETDGWIRRVKCVLECTFMKLTFTRRVVSFRAIRVLSNMVSYFRSRVWRLQYTLDTWVKVQLKNDCL